MNNEQKWPPVDLYLIFEKCSCKNHVRQTGFLAFKINFEIDFCRLKIQFVELDLYNWIFQKSSTDQQGVGTLCQYPSSLKSEMLRKKNPRQCFLYSCWALSYLKEACEAFEQKSTSRFARLIAQNFCRGTHKWRKFQTAKNS